MDHQAAPRIPAVALPPAFDAADAAANRAQAASRYLTGTELLLLVVAAVTATVSWRLGGSELDVPAAIGTCAFLASLAVASHRNRSRPQATWVRSRGVAESIRSAAWCYAVAGEPFPPDHPWPEEALQQQIGVALTERADLRPPQALHEQEITDWMRTTRAAPFAQRRDTYGSARLDDQIAFYRRGAARHDRGRRLWFAVGAVANAGGAVAGLLRFFGLVEVDFIGIAVALASGTIAWSELLQHRALAPAYATTARQLGLVLTRLGEVAESAWPGFVRSAEELMARERSIWLGDRTAHRTSHG
jgi:hypothetical protein